MPREVIELRHALVLVRRSLDVIDAGHRAEIAALESQLAAMRAQVAAHEYRLVSDRIGAANMESETEKLKNLETLESPPPAFVIYTSGAYGGAGGGALPEIRATPDAVITPEAPFPSKEAIAAVRGETPADIMDPEAIARRLRDAFRKP
jgi:hypothetical protein